MMEQKFCQSCGMPLSDATVLGTETNGSKNEEYCCYCYADGHFTVDCTMDEMIDHCALFVDEFNKDSEMKMTKDILNRSILKRDQLKNRKFCDFIYSNGTAGNGTLLRKNFVKC